MSPPSRSAIWIVLFLHPMAAGSAELQLQLDQLEYGPVKLKSLRGHLHPNKWSLAADSLVLPYPPWQVDALSLTCRDDNQSLPSLRCPDGRVDGKLPRLDSIIGGLFRYDFTPTGSRTIAIDPFKFNDSRWRLDYAAQGPKWTLKADTHRQTLENGWVRPLLPKSLAWIEQIAGEFGVSLHLEGDSHATRLHLNLDARHLALQDSEFSRVMENLRMSLHSRAVFDHKGWSGQLETRLEQGEILFLPVYVPLTSNPIRLNTLFLWNQDIHQLKFWDASLSQQTIGQLFLKGKIDNGIISRLDARYQINLPAAFQLYAFPFLEGGHWESIDVKAGKASGRFIVALDRPEGGQLVLDSVIISDAERRLGVNQLSARLNWQRSLLGQRVLFPASHISWHAAHIYAIPVGKTDLFLRLTADDLRLLHPAHIPILDGMLRLDRFELLDVTSTPKIQLAGEIESISLELLTRVLGIPPLAGTLSGSVPGVSYDHQSHTLKLDGKLTVEVFDGTLTIENLVVTDLFGVLPRLQADIFFHDLDLELVTRHFSFGKITGRLEGYVKSLQLENWRPVSFDAWLGTPAGDTTKHRISQQAIANLTDLGGGGATGMFSRTFLRFFEEFSYHRIGLGLRLNRKVCQLHGVAPASNGYYIVTGAGLPRIDVIGYNRRIDWPTLLARLARITQIKPPVVQ